ncbi:hypothetical protein [Streptomyces sp. Rer75]|uniref:hypothetical protein n=1 Tax=unclassified Streptomyces TaxID=2593676 RepID=UPI0015CFC5B4|nr:hypothetical protein [Streptomyces sp. Rer75]QLH21556.1 hypothetical protein HYQ63_13735 [Streptomyces sp. Rer75]
MSGGGGGGNADFKVTQESVGLITKGLRGAIGELKDVGSSTGALQGSGFQDMTMSKMEAGGGGLADAFEGFCDRWEWGVRALIQDANEIANRLGIAAGASWEEDQYWGGTFKVAVNALSPTGNPHATEEEIAKQSWGDVLRPDAPDYSAESWKQAGAEMGQTWKDTGRSLMTEGYGGFQTGLANDIAGVDDQQFDQAVDDTFGPSPEERAQAQAQQQQSQGTGGGDH